MATGVLFFLLCLSFNVYYGRKDNNMTKDLALSLIRENQNMMVTYNSIRNTIEKINAMKLNVRFSQVSLEKFKLGNFLEGDISLSLLVLVLLYKDHAAKSKTNMPPKLTRIYQTTQTNL